MGGFGLFRKLKFVTEAKELNEKIRLRFQRKSESTCQREIGQGSSGMSREVYRMPLSETFFLRTRGLQKVPRRNQRNLVGMQVLCVSWKRDIPDLTRQTIDTEAMESIHEARAHSRTTLYFHADRHAR